MNLNETFWDDRYQNQDIGWDIGQASTPLKTYFDQLTNKNLKILIPGGGNSYEAEYLHQLGFANVYVIDLSTTALQNIKKRIPTFPEVHLLHGNFFDAQGKFDLIIEQTFFCAIDKKLRPEYVKQAHQLLSKNGKIIGLLFDAPLNEDHPPFGGNKIEYIDHFQSCFDIQIMENCYNSIASRAGRELFVKMIKK